MQKHRGDSLIQVEHLSKGFSRGSDTLQVLQEISLSAEPGELIAIIGPSGCGKSTFFNILAGLIAPDAGSISLNSKKVPNLRGRMAYMQQKDLLLPWRNTLDNAILGMEIQGEGKRVAREQARDLLKTFGLEGFGD
ncbi:MAG: ATP-binding cassette domain-containing protein, partial [Syntrophobacterales bacterium]